MRAARGKLGTAAAVGFDAFVRPADLPPGDVVTATTVGDLELGRVPLDLSGG